MNIFGLSITRQKWAGGSLASVNGRGGWYPIVHEPYTGAWQQNRSLSNDDVLRHSTVWACISLIARDISKLWLDLVALDERSGVWTKVENSAYSPVLNQPNRFQNRIQFIESWVISKLTNGNTYVLLQRNNRGGERNGNVEAMYILDPTRVKPLVAPDGSVFYQLSDDPLSGLQEATVVPSSEIIHDRYFPVYHPLVGVSPIAACGLAAMNASRIQNNSEQFFANQSQPGGLLIAPGPISTENAEKLEKYWEANFTGVNAGRVAVVSDGMKYERMGVTPHDALVVDQLKLSAEIICGVFFCPLWKLGLAALPPYGNVQAANVEYFSVALQNPIECIELCLDKGLDTGTKLGTEFDVDALLRMDTATQMDIATKGVGGGIYSPNEARAVFDMKPVKGGESPLLQQQMYSLQALSERDQDKPFSKPVAGPQGAPPRQEPVEPSDEDDEKDFDASEHDEFLRKVLGMPVLVAIDDLMSEQPSWLVEGRI